MPFSAEAGGECPQRSGRLGKLGVPGCSGQAGQAQARRSATSACSSGRGRCLVLACEHGTSHAHMHSLPTTALVAQGISASHQHRRRLLNTSLGMPLLSAPSAVSPKGPASRCAASREQPAPFATAAHSSRHLAPNASQQSPSSLNRTRFRTPARSTVPPNALGCPLPFVPSSPPSIPSPRARETPSSPPSWRHCRTSRSRGSRVLRPEASLVPP